MVDEGYSLLQCVRVLLQSANYAFLGVVAKDHD